MDLVVLVILVDEMVLLFGDAPEKILRRVFGFVLFNSSLLCASL